MSNSNISMAVIRRLPKYHRYLRELMEKDITRISSNELSDIIGFTASQIRQDLNNFGGFGQQGYGYDVPNLFKEINKILGLDQDYNVVIIGAGNLGQALANYNDFNNFGFKLTAIFDVNPRLIGMQISGTEVYDVDELEAFIEKNDVHFAYICTHRDAAQDIADRLTETNIKGIWNFAPIDIKVKRDDITVQNVHLIDNLLTLTYLSQED